MKTKIVSFFLLFLFSLNLFAVNLSYQHNWTTPDNIGFRSYDQAEVNLQNFLSPLTSGYSDQKFRKSDFVEAVIKNYLKGVFYVEVRGIYHIGTYENNGKCRMRAAQHTWVNVENIDIRDISSPSMPSYQYLAPNLNPNDWSALGELSFEHDEVTLNRPCNQEQNEIDNFYNFTKDEFHNLLSSNHPMILNALTQMASQGAFGSGNKSLELPISELIDIELKKQNINTKINNYIINKNSK